MLFTGLIQEKGRITAIKRQAHTIQMTCTASKALLVDYQIGDSMSINGACLTAIGKSPTGFSVEIMPETFKRTTFTTAKVNDEVNLERAMAFHQRFEGHLVAGHIDAAVRLIEKRENENAVILTFAYPPELAGEIISQGSIAVNGVSLTVTQVSQGNFSVSLIPHSRMKTTLGTIKRGELVNIETDMIGKYVKAQGKSMQQLRGEGIL